MIYKSRIIDIKLDTDYEKLPDYRYYEGLRRRLLNTEELVMDNNFRRDVKLLSKNSPYYKDITDGYALRDAILGSKLENMIKYKRYATTSFLKKVYNAAVKTKFKYHPGMEDKSFYI